MKSDWERVQRAGLAFYRHAAWSGLSHGIFTRLGGVSQAPYASLNVGASNGDDPAAVQENHRRMFRAAELNPERAVSCWLVHGVDVLVIKGEQRPPERLAKVDAILCDQPDTPLVMRFADCVPLLLYDPVQGAIALGHAGWRGTVQGIAGVIVRTMVDAFGSAPRDIQALIGPAISARNYPVGEAVAAAARASFGAADGIIQHSADGTPHLDLWRANHYDLLRQGLEQIRIMEHCTSENTHEFFSHRAENGRTGRFGVVMSL